MADNNNNLVEDSTTKENQGTDPQKSGNEEQTPKTYTADELQEELNKLAAKVRKEEKDKYEKKAEEEKRLAKMSQDEREKAEAQKKDNELAEAKATIERMKLENRTSELLSEKKIPDNFKSFLMGKDEDETVNNIASFKETFDAAVQAGVEERLKTNAPKAGEKPQSGGLAGFNLVNYASEKRKIEH